MTRIQPFFATSPRNTEDLLAGELASLGAAETKETPGGVHFSASLETAYRVCLHSRIGGRVLAVIASFPAGTEKELYEGARETPWEEHFGPDTTFAVSGSIAQSALKNASYAALKIKDGIADRFRDRSGRRPTVNTDDPGIRIAFVVRHDLASASIDLSGEGLYRRGYRRTRGDAPLKENLAAAMLLRLGWHQAEPGSILVDPFCGSGTILIEGALMAAGIPPGIFRRTWGFGKWKGHEPAVWQRILREGLEMKRTGLVRIGNRKPSFFGFDIDSKAVASAIGNVTAIGLRDVILVETGSYESAGRRVAALRAGAEGGGKGNDGRSVAAASAPMRQTPAPEDQVPSAGRPAGFLCSNPPYGRRLGSEDGISALYRGMGQTLLREFPGWKAGLLVGDRELSKTIALRAVKVNILYNGPIECAFAQFLLEDRYAFRTREAPSLADSPGARMFENRLRKNRKLLAKEAAGRGVTCYRLYDADMPEYSFAVDLYEDRWIVVQEYAPPKTVDPVDAERRRNEALAVISVRMGFDRDVVFFRTRERQRGKNQYGASGHGGELRQVREGECRFLVNFTDYLDTGLFLDHRDTRKLIGSMARGKRFLNLFGYTGTATVHAVLGGASESVTVDASPTYLAWAEKNFRENGIDPRGPSHRLVRADVLPWLAVDRGVYDLIFIDPPTFSNSKDRRGAFDVQKDHVALLTAAAARLSDAGAILFSTNYRRFSLDADAVIPFLTGEEITGQTIPFDFSRNARIHRVWLFRKKHNKSEVSS